MSIEDAGEVLVWDANGSVIAAVDRPRFSECGKPFYYQEGEHAGYFVSGRATVFSDYKCDLAGCLSAERLSWPAIA